MIQDLNLRMDYQMTLTTSAQSTSFIDTLAQADAMPAGSLAMWKVICTTSPVATAGTLTITLQTSPNSLFDSNAVTLASSAALTISNIKAQTANIAPPQSIPWPYTPASVIVGPILVWVAIPVGCMQYLRTGYSFSAGASYTTNPGFTSLIVLDGDKLLENVLNLPADIK